MKPISQVEARRLRKRVNQLEGVLAAQRLVYSKTWPSGIYIAQDASPSIEVHQAIKTARILNHAVFVIPYDNQLFFYADPIPSGKL